MIRHVFLLVALFVVVSHGHPTTSSSIVVVDPTSATTATAKVTDAAVEAKTPDNNKPEDVGSSTKHLKPKVTSMHVESNVTLRYAKTLVTSRVSNPASKANEVTFSVVIPETAFITGFSMEIDGKVYEAYVKEKAEAKKVYQAAVNSGYAAAHVAVQARDSNHFTVSVNVEPESKAIFRLTYEELLYRRLGLYNLVMNINPGQLLEDLSVDVNIDESAPIKGLFVPQLRTGNEVDAEEGDAENQFSTIDISEDKLRATVHFAPNKTQQLELMRIFKEREHQTTTPSNSYNPFEPIPRKVASDEDGLKGQFVVQYDVDRDVKGEILLNDGYFVHFFAPTDLKPLNKHVIFVLDVSGSMVGRKVAQLKEAMNSILSDLLPGDWFSIIDFSYSANVYDLDNTSRNSQFHQSDRYYFGEEMVVRKEPEIPPPPKPATPENIAKAKVIIDQLVATGGTNIHDALTVALRVANRGIQLSANETETVPKPLPSPMIIFLTDGEPTVGDTNLDNILTAVKDINTKKVALFSLAFGEDADRGFLRRVSLQNNGFMRHIYEAADAAQQLRHFYKQVASPLLANVTLTYPQDQIDEDSLTKKTFNYFFLGSELVIAGRTKSNEGDTALVLPHAPNFKLEASSFGGPIDFIPIVPVEEKRTTFWPLERMWAYLTIKQLLDEKDARNKDGDDTAEGSPTQKALKLALKYSFVTPLTSLVVVKPNSTAAVDAESVEAGGAKFGAGYALPLVANSYAPQSPMYQSDLQDRFVGANPQSLFGAPSYALSFIPPALPAGGQGYAGSSGLLGGSFGGSAVGAAAPQASFDTLSDPNPYSVTESLSFDVHAEEESEPFTTSDDEDTVQSLSVSTTPRQQLETEQTTEVKEIIPAKNEPAKPTKADRLKSYNLEAFPWLQEYLVDGEDAFSIPSTSTKPAKKYLLKNKTKTPSAADSAPVEPPCQFAEGVPGTCRYLTDCKDLSTVFKDLPTFLARACDAGNGLAGICYKLELP